MHASWQPDAQRKRFCKTRYGENVAGKWVRKSAFREIDYDPNSPDRLREFDTFDAAFEFDEARRLDGTGGRHAKPYPKPKDTVPKEQLALQKAMTHAVQEDGNKTRVQLEHVEDGLHEALSEMRAEMRAIEAKTDKIIEYHEKVPPSNPDDLALMEKVLNKFKVGRMNTLLKQFQVDRPAGVKREGKASLIV